MKTAPLFTPASTVPFASGLAERGRGVAVVAPDAVLTYDDLDARVGELAERLGYARRLVLVSAANRVEPLVAYLAALRAGHPVILAPADNRVAQRSLLQTYDPDVVFSSHDGWEMTERRAVSDHVLHPDLALLMATSGSTGSSKLVRLSRRNLQANAESISEYLSITPDDRAITTLPMSYCYGLSVVNSHLASGAGLVLTEGSVVDGYFWELFRSTAATSFAGVPYTFEMLDRIGFDAMSLPSLRYVTQAGGRMAPAHVRRYAELGSRRGWELFVMYGQTEATARMAYLPPALAIEHPQAVGIAVPGGSFQIEDIDGAGPSRGELVYRGPNVMLGYAAAPADLARGAEVDALHTGDVAVRNSAGLYEIVGRRSRFVKLFGVRTDLDDLERMLAASGVEALCGGDDGALAVAVARPRTGAVSATGTLAAQVAARIGAHLGLPSSRVKVVEVAELPRLANGKPDYLAVSRLAEAPAGPHGDESEMPTNVRVRALYAEVLGRDIGDDDSFVTAGGDSLSYVEISVALEELLGRLPDDWHMTPVGCLVAAPGSRRRARHVETGVALRAVATVLVVGTHAGLWHIRGAAHLLLGIAGFNFARFGLGTFGAERRRAFRSIARIAVPSVVWIGIVAATTAEFGWPHVVLLNGYLGGTRSSFAYWYVEALVQILVVLAVVLAVPKIRRLERRHRFGFPLAVLLIGLAVRFDIAPTPQLRFPSARPHEIAWIFALGWAAARACRGRDRIVLSALAVVATPGFFGSGTREMVLLAGVLTVIWVEQVRLPWPLNRVAGALAGASLYVYLTHWQVYPPVTRAFGAPAAVVVSLLVGVAVWLVVRRVSARIEAAGVGHIRMAGRRAGPSSGSSPGSSAASTALSTKETT